MDTSKQTAFEAWARQQTPAYVLHTRPAEQQRGPANIYSNQRTQHAYEGFAGAMGSHDQLVAALRQCAELIRAEVADGAYTEQFVLAHTALAAAGAA